MGIYKKYGEEIGYEGKARDEIMKMVLADGWVRVRHQTSRSEDYWIIQFYNFTNITDYSEFAEKKLS